MAISLDFEVDDDHLVFDGRHTVAVRSVKADRSYTEATVANAIRGALSRSEIAASNGAYTGQDVTYRFRAQDCTITPKPGDKVVYSGAVWTVLQSQTIVWGRSHRLICRNLSIAYDLRDEVDIQRPAITRDTAGGLVKAWPPSGGRVVYTGLKAKVQLLSEAKEEYLDVAGFTGQYSVYVDDQIVIQPTDRLKWGTIFLEIKTIRNPNQIAQLPVLDCVKVPGV